MKRSTRNFIFALFILSLSAVVWLVYQMGKASTASDAEDLKRNAQNGQVIVEKSSSDTLNGEANFVKDKKNATLNASYVDSVNKVVDEIKESMKTQPLGLYPYSGRNANKIKLYQKFIDQLKKLKREFTEYYVIDLELAKMITHSRGHLEHEEEHKEELTYIRRALVNAIKYNYRVDIQIEIDDMIDNRNSTLFRVINGHEESEHIFREISSRLIDKDLYSDLNLIEFINNEFKEFFEHKHESDNH